MEVFVLKALERLLAEAGRRDTDFRDAANAVIGESLAQSSLSAARRAHRLAVPPHRPARPRPPLQRRSR